MSRYQRYPEYRDSGVEWIGEIPGHWEVKQTRHIFKIFSGSTPKSGEEIFWDGDITWFTPDDLGNNQQKNISESRRKITEEGYKSCGTSLAKKNSIVFSTRAPIGHIALSTVPACCNQGCRILEPENGNIDYWYYTLVSAKPVLQSLGQGSTFMELPRQSLASFNLPFPSLEEQQAIASFLDRKTAEIDELITKKEDLLKKLDEKRTALITRAVTKGLDPSAPMKESGVEWLGEIPKHWEVKKLKYVTDKVQTGTTPQSNDDEYFLDTTIIWYTPSDFSDQSLMLTDSKRKLNKIAIENGIVKIIPAGSVLVIGIGATLGKVGLSINQCCCNQQINGISPNRLIDAKFLLYSLLIKQEIMKLISNATTLGIMNQEKTKSIQLCIPPIEEQQAITEQIEKKTATIDLQKAQVTEAIERLKEYRSALITNAVTGKMDVQLHRTREILSA